MTAATLTRPNTNEERLIEAGVTVDHLPADLRAQLNELGTEEIQTLIDLKRRFAGDLALDPAMFQGSDLF